MALLAGLSAGLWWWRADPDRRASLLVSLGVRPDPLAVAEAGLESLRLEQQLVVMSARFLTRQSSRRELTEFLPPGLLTGEQTLIVAGTVRYALDLSRLDAAGLRWEGATATLTVRRPPMLLLGPSFHVTDMDELEEGAFVVWLTGSEKALADANWAKARAAMLADARSEALRRQADAEADRVLARLFRLPLVAAGFEDAKVVVAG